MRSRHLDQESIANRMAERIVDVLEAVEIDIEQRKGGRAAAGGDEELLQPLDEGRAVGEPGQRIGARQPRDLFLGDLALGDVDQQAFDFGQAAGGVANLAVAVFHPAIVAAAGHQPELEHAARVIAFQRPRLLFAHVGDVVGMDQLLIEVRRFGQHGRLIAEQFDVLRDIDHRQRRHAAQPVKYGRRVLDDAVGVGDFGDVTVALDGVADQVAQRRQDFDFEIPPRPLALAVVEADLAPVFAVDGDRHDEESTWLSSAPAFS